MKMSEVQEADYDVVKKFGEGQYGAVHLVPRRTDGQRFVLKKAKTDRVGDSQRRAIRKESRLLMLFAVLSCVNVVLTFAPLMDVSGDIIGMLLPFYEEGGANRFFKHAKMPLALEILYAAFLFRDYARGLQHMFRWALKICGTMYYPGRSTDRHLLGGCAVAGRDCRPATVFPWLIMRTHPSEGFLYKL